MAGERTAVSARKTGEFRATYLLDGELHRWMVPEAALEISISDAALQRLAHSMGTFGRRIEAGEQVGGLLLGGRASGGPSVIRISNFDTYSGASLHQVLRLITERLGEQQRDAGPDEAGNEQPPIGWYRLVSQGRGITADDVSLLRKGFGAGENVLLLLRPGEKTARFSYPRAISSERWMPSSRCCRTHRCGPLRSRRRRNCLRLGRWPDGRRPRRQSRCLVCCWVLAR